MMTACKTLGATKEGPTTHGLLHPHQRQPTNKKTRHGKLTATKLAQTSKMYFASQMDN
jgi:hypothetical protein